MPPIVQPKIYIKDGVLVEFVYFLDLKFGFKILTIIANVLSTGK